MIFLNIIDLLAINYDSIRFLLSQGWPVFIRGSLKFINSEKQNEKHHYRILNDENFWGSLIKWFGIYSYLSFHRMLYFKVNHKSFLCSIYNAEELIERISQQQDNWFQNHKLQQLKRLFTEIDGKTNFFSILVPLAFIWCLTCDFIF